MSRLLLNFGAGYRRLGPAGQPWWALLLALFAGLGLALLPWWQGGGLLLGLSAVFLILLQPLLGLGLALLAGPFGALESLLLNLGLLDSGQLLLFLVLAAWMAQGVLRRRIAIPHTRLNFPLVLFIATAAISLLRAPSLLFGLKELIKWVEMALVMWLVVDLAGRERGRRSTVHLLPLLVLMAAFSQALIGIWQFGLRSDGPEHFLILDRFYRAYGTFEQPNPFGGYMAMSAALGIGAVTGLLAAWGQRWWTAWKQGRDFRHLWHRDETVRLLLLAGPTAAVVLALLFSWSRGAWLGFAAAMAVFALFLPRRRWQGLAVAVSAGILLLAGWQMGLVPDSVGDRISSFSDDFRLEDVRGADINDGNYAVLERLAHWQSALEMGRENFWLGVGFGNYEPAYADYALINWPYPLGHAHNYYLNLLAEVGVLGLSAYLFFWIVVFWQLIGLLRRLDWPRRGLALGLLAVWVALSVHQLVDKLYVNNLYIFLGALLGLQQILEGNDD